MAPEKAPEKAPRSYITGAITTVPLLPHSRTPNPEMRLKCLFKFGVESHLQVPSGRCHISGSFRLYLSSIQPTQQALLQLYVILAYRQNTTTEATLTDIPLQVNTHVETTRCPPKYKFSYFYGLSLEVLGGL
jgi:hypothetical protein